MLKNNTHYDVIVVGAGPAGFASAIRCAQHGLKTACIDNWRNKKNQGRLGGSHLNTGGVASMTLLESAKLYHQINHDIGKHGIHVAAVTIDLPLMIQRKDKIVDQIGHKMADLFSHHKIDYIQANAKLLNSRQVGISAMDTKESSVLNATYIILATGSSPIKLPYAPIDNDCIIDSITALNLDVLPKKLAIIGAGVVGLELASIWNRLGSEIILLEAQENFLSLLDQQISGEAYRVYQDQGFDLRLGARVISAKKGSKKVTVDYQDQDGTHSLRVDKLIVACGRKPNTAELAAPEANLLLDENGYIYVDDNCRTNLPGIYAIGDLTLLGPMLAHKGIEEGVFVADIIAGFHNPINYENLPSVIYTEPEIAWVGQTEQALRATGEAIKIGIYPLTATIRALAMGKPEGMVKIIASAATDKILGVHIIGTQASELIAEAVLAMEFSASSEDLARTIHARPTLSEAVHDAALALKDKALHLVRDA
jgi:dihydrolipoamide dehydrogenase